ncbi:MAG: MBL fold metallo-hydrolase [Sphingomicrobium sp.]
MSEADLDQPGNQEIEVSVFGRGFGECIVCHIGDGQWVIVDSLLTQDGRPVAPAYLEGIGVDLGQVQSIILTHWHDDHVRGASDIVARCPNATVTFPITLCQDEFKQVLKRYGNVVAGRFTNGVEELLRTLETLGGQKHRRKYAIANRVIIETGDARVEALSPSDEDVEKFIVAIHEWAGEARTDGRIAKPRRNDTSVVVVVKVADELILLGGDLEVRDSLSGWQAVHEIAWGGRGKAKVFKVAHHGSITGEYAPVWDDLLDADPISVLAPYNRGHKLPTTTDVARISMRSGEAFAASTLEVRRGSRQNRTVERTLAEANIRLFRMPPEVGQVRLRKRIGSDEWTVALFQSACRLEDIAA